MPESTRAKKATALSNRFEIGSCTLEHATEFTKIVVTQCGSFQALAKVVPAHHGTVDGLKETPASPV